MSANTAIEVSIHEACSDTPRDFTAAETDYIRARLRADPSESSDFVTSLFGWFETSLSDGHWTERSAAFMRALQQPSETRVG